MKYILLVERLEQLFQQLLKNETIQNSTLLSLKSNIPGTKSAFRDTINKQNDKLAYCKAKLNFFNQYQNKNNKPSRFSVQQFFMEIVSVQVSSLLYFLNVPTQTKSDVNNLSVFDILSVLIKICQEYLEMYEAIDEACAKRDLSTDLSNLIFNYCP